MIIEKPTKIKYILYTKYWSKGCFDWDDIRANIPDGEDYRVKWVNHTN